MDVHDTTLPEDREPVMVPSVPVRARGRPKGSLTKKAILEPPRVVPEGPIFRAMPSQMEFLQAPEREVLFSGGMGSGKSVALLVDMVVGLSGNPNAVAILARRHQVSLNRSTLPILISNTGSMPPVLPPGTYDYKKAEGIIQLHGGGKILLIGVDFPERFRSINASELYVDEASELTEDIYNELLYRVRLDSGRGHVRLATNPKYVGHWAYKRFIGDPKGHRVIYGNSLDNKYLSKEYRSYLEGLTGDRFLRYVKGVWTARGEMVYPEWDSTTMVSEVKAEPAREWFIGVDFGGTNPTAMLACYVDESGCLNVVDEFYKVQSTFSEMLRWCEQYRQYRPTVIRDPSAKSVETEFLAASWEVVNGDNGVEVGIERCRDRFANKAVKVDPKCKYLIQELDGYSWDADKPGKPVKENDHAADAFRYVCGSVTESYVGAIGSVEKVFFA